VIINEKIESLPATNPNPVLRVENDGTVIYSNEAADPLLIEWDIKVGGKLPSIIRETIRRVIYLNNPEKIEVIADERVYLLAFHPLLDEKCVDIYGFDIFDISDQKNIQETNKMIHLIMNNIPQGIFWKDRNSRYIGCNKVFAKAAGVESPARIVGKTDYDLPWSPEQTKWFREYDRKVMENDTPEYHIVEPSREADGKMAWVETNKIPLHDAKGNVIGILGISEDITKRKQLEEQTRQRVEELETLMDIVPVAIFIGHDPKCHNITGNKMANELYESRLGENVSANVSHLRRIFQKGIELTVDELPMQKAADENINVRNEELEWLLPSGDRRAVLGSASPLHDAEGNVRGSIGAFIDITERRKTEAKLEETLENLEKLVKERTLDLQKAYNALKESEKGLAEAQSMAHIGNWEWDIATDKAYWSEEMYRIFKRDPQKLAPPLKEYYSYIHPDDLDYYCKINDYNKKVPTAGLDFRIVLADGEERTLHIKSDFIFNDENNPIRVKGIVQDVTESKKAEEKIKYLANVVESSLDAIGTISLDGIITSWNKGAEQVYGYSSQEIIGKHVSILAQSYLKDETKRLSELVKQGEKIHQFETLRFRKDGKPINVSITLSPVFDVHGKLTSVSFISRDITERKRSEEKLLESEEKYRNIVETANEGIIITDNKAIITYVNRKMADMLGYSLEEGIGRPIWNFISEESKAIVELNINKWWYGTYETYESKLMRKDGSSLWALINAKPLFDKDDKYMGAMCMVTDITGLKKAEEALKNFEIARKKEIHHRIKNNLQVISSLLDLQAEQFSNRECINDSEVLRAFRESQDRVTSMALIHEELYRGEETDRLDFSSYIKELADNLFLTYRIGNKDIGLNIDLEEKAFFDIDTAIPLGIIINELVSNSFKYAFQGRDKGEIRIRLRREECNNTSFILTISDNGVGIPEDLDIENLDSLGMQLVSTLVDQLDGELELKRDGGTEFIIKFTIIKDNNQSQMAVPHLVDND
jgi:PAS domain S-box-containing protein